MAPQRAPRAEPTPDSPAPFMPSGVNGDSVSWWPTSNMGSSTAVGMV